MLAHLRGMEMQPNIPRYHEDAVARGIFVAVAKDGLPRLRLHDLSFQFIPLAHSTLYLQNTLRVLFIGIDTRLHAKHDALVHDQLTIFPHSKFNPVHRARGWPLKVIAGLVVPAAMTRAFVFVLGSQPARRTTQ